MDPPPGFEFVRAGGATILVDAARRERYLLEGLARPSVLAATARPRAGGRGGAMDLTIGGDDVVLRLVRRGGLLRFVLRERTWSRDRAFREVAALASMRARGVPAVQPVAAVATPAGLGLYRHALLTLRARGTQDLLEALDARTPPDREGADRERVECLQAAARAVKAGFDAGLDPPDLTPRNLLLTDSERPECLWVDLDRARVHPGPLSEAARIRALARFVRYVETHRPEGSDVLSHADCLRFVRSVVGAGAGARAVWVRVARTRRLHSIGARWRPRPWRTSPGSRGALALRGPETPLDPAVSVLFAVRHRGEGRAIVEAFLRAADAAGLRSFELVGLARAPGPLHEMRALSARVPSLRFLGDVERNETEAWRRLLRSARAPRILSLDGWFPDPVFLTEALERLEEEADVVAAVRSGRRRTGERIREVLVKLLTQAARGVPVRDLSAPIVARNDDRLQAAVRALRAKRLVRADLLARLAEAGARFGEVPAREGSAPGA